MLLTLMSNLGMFGGNVPPTPSEETEADGFLPFEYENQTDKIRRRKRVKKTNDELLVIINSFLVCQN